MYIHMYLDFTLYMYVQCTCTCIVYNIIMIYLLCICDVSYENQTKCTKNENGVMILSRISASRAID